ncbi:ribokinase [Undibacterium fentianense]|uniref:Ribokinase n=1 Tax=Undibacterium fentianense TaxID=2828728 RepID=A0A941E4Y8_9BURK|nr:ribokinase [Undibacterium fentianense]MBR7799828.1 ribokinase [Undibacterium fentianense]
MSAKIAVVGSINMDLVFSTPRMPLPGETLMGHQFHQIHGGKGANQAVAAARAGGSVALLACVGNDVNGHSSLQALQSEGIDCQYVRNVDGMATGVAAILLDDLGQNSIVLAIGANALVSPVDVDSAQQMLSKSQIMLCQLETPLESVRHAVELAVRSGVQVVLNPAPAQALDDVLLAQVNYLVLNETEASMLTDIRVIDVLSAAEAASALQRRGVPVVIVTLGGEGIWVADIGSAYSLPAFKVNVVDTTAAGDTFVGALSVALAEGQVLRQACLFAQAAAACAVTKLGAQTSIPNRSAIERQLQNQ